MKLPKLAYKSILKFCLKTFVIFGITLLLFETVYRFYLIDFYRGNLNGLNTKDELTCQKEKTILVFGDSFSADLDGWVDVLRDSLPDNNVINSAIPGTSVFHHKLFFADRIEEFPPDEIIIQLYVGNDLVDYKRPINFTETGFFRNIYWWFSDVFISLQYLNYQAGQISANGTSGDPKNDALFDVNSYNNREKIYFAADSMTLYNSVNVLGNQQVVYKDMIEDLHNMLDEIEIPVRILVVPHSAQVSLVYANNISEVGAYFQYNEADDCAFLNGVQDSFKANKRITVLNALPILKLGNRQGGVYYSNDPHLNNFGQEVLGNWILESLKNDK